MVTFDAIFWAYDTLRFIKREQRAKGVGINFTKSASVSRHLVAIIAILYFRNLNAIATFRFTARSKGMETVEAGLTESDFTDQAVRTALVLAF